MNRLAHILVLAIFLAASARAATVEDLRCEYLVNPLGLDAVRPRLSWIVRSSRRGEKQTAYQILVASSLKMLDKGQGDLWDSGKVDSDESAQIEYAGKPLISRRRCFWKARIWDQERKPGAWSPAARWQMGLLEASDWSAQWIGAPLPDPQAGGPLVIRRAVYESEDGGASTDVTSLLAGRVKENRLALTVNNRLLGDPAYNHKKQLRIEYEFAGHSRMEDVPEDKRLTLPPETAAPPYLRKSFALRSSVERAVLYATALGLYEMRINGRRVGDHVLAPDWTDYRKRVRYQAYDVTTLVKRGANVMGAFLGDGWYSGHIGNGGYQFFGKNPALLAQLEVTYADGHVEKIVTDDSWKSHDSPILSSDFMYGENYDARMEISGWDKPGLDDGKWEPARVLSEPSLLLESQVSEPVRQLGEITPKAVTEPKAGRWIYDLGQNMVGVARLKVSAPAGTQVTLRHAEVLDSDGTLYTKNLRGASSIDRYICRGDGTEIWQPRFTFHGFRYVEVTGLPGAPRPGAVTGIVIGSDTPRAGQFTCSDPRLNQLQSNIQWGQRGNYLSVPTDCPQRDERLGWMGDAQVFVHTAVYNADVAAFFSKWLVDVDDGQSASGSFSDVSPNTTGDRGVPGWGDAGVICPWTIYESYGDKRILERHLPAMIKWIEYMKRHSDGLIRDRDRGHDYGDWLSINADTPKDLIGTAFFAHSTDLVAQACKALGRKDEAAKYEQLFRDIRTAFDEQYVGKDGRIRGNTQCAYALALKFDLLPDELRARAVQYLREDIKAKGGHLSTGFLGVGCLLPALADGGRADVAGELLLQDTFPSWLFSVKHGATTIWERWDGWTPEKGFQDPGMNSFNHYSLGSCGEYLFGYVGGIRAAEPGFKAILIDPAVDSGLQWASAQYDSIHGRIAASWKSEGPRFALNVTIPANTTAMVRIPAADGASVTENDDPIERAANVKLVRRESDRVVVAIGSGTYKFVATARAVARGTR